MEGNVALSNRWTFFLWLTALNLYCFIRAWKKQVYSLVPSIQNQHISHCIQNYTSVSETRAFKREILHNLLWLFQFSSRHKHRRNQYFVHNSTSVPTKCSLYISLFSLLFLFLLFLFHLIYIITTTAMIIFSSHLFLQCVRNLGMKNDIRFSF